MNPFPPNDFPKNWAEIAKAVKTAAGLKCERCEQPHDVLSFHVLTVHHLDGDKGNNSRWNLAALCPTCKDKLNCRIRLGQIFTHYTKPVSDWFKPHLEGYLRELEKEKTGPIQYAFACAACGHCWQQSFDGATPTDARIKNCPVCGMAAFPQSR